MERVFDSFSGFLGLQRSIRNLLNTTVAETLTSQRAHLEIDRALSGLNADLSRHASNVNSEGATPLPYGSIDKPRLKMIHHLSDSLKIASTDLFFDLVHRSRCCGNHIARIHLDGFGVGDRLTENFSLFLSSTSDDQDCHWQQTLCRIITKRDALSLKDDERELCNLLNKCCDLGQPLLFQLHQIDGKLAKILGEELSGVCEEVTPIKSLGALIQEKYLVGCEIGGSFPQGSKATICLNLSLALIHLSANEWFPNHWSVDNIFFACDYGEGGIAKLDTERPYLSAWLKASKGKELPDAERETTLYLPRGNILSFAQILMEIYLGERLDGKIQSSRNHYGLLWALTEREDIQRSVPKHVRHAVRSCIEFVRKNGYQTQPSSHWIFTEVVHRLGLTQEIYDPPPSTLRYLMQPGISSRKRNLETTSLDVSSKRAHKQFKTSSSEKWFTSFRSLAEVLRDKDGETGHHNPRVAILDTGISPAEAKKYKFPAERYFDFTNLNHKAMVDNTGHGTSVFELIGRICPSAVMYVARVWEFDEVTENTVDLTIKALDWAMERRVDVICMASGFYENVSTLEDQLRRAFAENILIFAAASNDGNLGQVAFPARCRDTVIRVFSTDERGKNSRDINPAGLGGRNFAILGENIRFWHSNKTDSGTSFATAIACGLAACLLNLARQKELDKGEFTGLGEKIKQKYILEDIFQEISVPDAEYYCILPWRLLISRHRGEDDFTDDEIARARDRICVIMASCAGML